MKRLLLTPLAPFRILRSSPAVVAGVSLSIGVGLGGCLAVLGLLGGRILAPLPYSAASQLAVVENIGVYHIDGVREGEISTHLSVLDFEDVRAQARVFSDLGGAWKCEGTMRAGSRRRGVARVLVTPRLLPLLGVTPTLGRLLGEADFTPGAAPAVLLTESIWRRHFARDPNVAGRTIQLDDQAFTVAGVISDQSLAFLRQPSGVLDGPLDETIVSPFLANMAGSHSRLISDFFAPRRNAPALAIVGRLRPGRSAAEADAEVRAIGGRLAARHRENKDRGLRAEPFSAWYVAKVRGTIVLLVAAGLLVCLVTCLNATSLVLADAAGRQTEWAVMQALGAPVSSTVAAAVGRAVILTAPGGVVALGVGALGLLALDHYVADASRPLASVWLLSRVGLAAAASTLCAGLIAGGCAAWLSRPRLLADALKQGGSSSPSRGQHRLMKSFVTLQVAASTALVIGSGLMIRSVWNILDVDLGFDVRHNVMVRVGLPPERQRTYDDLLALVRTSLRRVRALPGVTAAGSSNATPLSGTFAAAAGLSIETSDGAEVLSRETVLGQTVTPGYFEALGMKLVRGRWLVESDMTNPAGAALVDEAFCERVLGGRLDPLTSRILFGRYPTPIVGVVGSVRPSGPLEPQRSMLYITDTVPSTAKSLYLVVRSDTLGARELGDQVVQEIRRVDPGAEIAEPVALETAFSRTIAARRQMLTLLTGATILVLVMTALSISSCLAQYIAGRRRDVAIRVALGAGPWDLQRLLARQIGWAVGLGLGEGALAGVALSWTLSSQFYGVSGTDPGTLACSIVLLGAIAAFAAFIPASRASRIDPARTLKAE